MDAESIWYGRSAADRAVSAALVPASALFGLAVRARSSLYDRGLLAAARAPRPVVSVGALTVGGAGKTPFVLWLVQRLVARGLSPCVVTRGYGRKGEGILLVRPGQLAGGDARAVAGLAAEAGDEPVLLSLRTGVPVAVGADRLGACRDALDSLQAGGSEVDLFVLDDGFQHRRLARDLDVVVLAGGEEGRRLLPAGPLREGLAALARADAVACGADGPPPSSLRGGALAMRMRRRVAGLVEAVDDREAGPVAPLRGARVVAVAAIARPGRFVADLEAAGARVVAEVLRADHHRYDAADREAIDRAARDADLVVTTEKDLVKLAALAGEAPIRALRIDLDVEDEGPLLDRIDALAGRSEAFRGV